MVFYTRPKWNTVYLLSDASPEKRAKSHEWAFIGVKNLLLKGPFCTKNWASWWLRSRVHLPVQETSSHPWSRRIPRGVEQLYAPQVWACAPEPENRTWSVAQQEPVSPQEQPAGRGLHCNRAPCSASLDKSSLCNGRPSPAKSKWVEFSFR